MANTHPLFAWLSKPTANAQKTHRRAQNLYLPCSV
jgi:hypothetical protein